MRNSPLKIYAAEPDPLDESHFTIRFDRGAETDVLDGRLTGDDQVTLRVRDAGMTPVTAPALAPSK